jgi:hypothetical protein
MRELITNEAAAWREVARRLSQRHRYASGLCAQLRRLTRDERVDELTLSAMEDRLDAHMDTMRSTDAYDWTGYYAPCGERGPRIIAALLLALESEDEASA